MEKSVANRLEPRNERRRIPEFAFHRIIISFHGFAVVVSLRFVFSGALIDWEKSAALLPHIA